MWYTYWDWYWVKFHCFYNIIFLFKPTLMFEFHTICEIIWRLYDPVHSDMVYWHEYFIVHIWSLLLSQLKSFRLLVVVTNKHCQTGCLVVILSVCSWFDWLRITNVTLSITSEKRFCCFHWWTSKLNFNSRYPLKRNAVNVFCCSHIYYVDHDQYVIMNCYLLLLIRGILFCCKYFFVVVQDGLFTSLYK